MKLYTTKITTPYMDYAYYDIICANSVEQAREICIKYHDLSELKVIMVGVKELEITCNSDTPKVASSIMID